jgi:hypothetical protein
LAAAFNMSFMDRTKNSYAATAFVTKRSVIAKRPAVIGQFMKAMAEAANYPYRSRICLQSSGKIS